MCHTPIDKLSNPFKTEWKDHVANKDNKVYFDPKCVKTMGSNWSRTRPTGTKNQPLIIRNPNMVNSNLGVVNCSC